MNGWFGHGQANADDCKPSADLCCNHCMVQCAESTSCENCLRKLKVFSKDQTYSDVSLTKNILTRFLISINLNKDRDDSSILNDGEAWQQ